MCPPYSSFAASSPPGDPVQVVSAPRALDRVIGAVILSAYLVPALLLAARSSPLAVESHLVESNDAPASIKALISAALACSAVNVATHAAVVANLLDDALVLSVLVGVGFDVASQIVTASMWAVLFWKISKDAGHGEVGDPLLVTRTPADVGLGLLLVATYVYALVTHIRALCLASSFDRLASVVRSAHNNIVGDPGPAYSDHVFAFLDLGAHAFQMITSGIVLGPTGAAKVLSTLGLTASVSYLLYVWVEASSTGSSEPKSTSPGTISVGEEGEPVCGCQVCRATGAKAFSVDVKRGRLCELWFLSFRQVLQVIDGLGVVRGRVSETMVVEGKKVR